MVSQAKRYFKLNITLATNKNLHLFSTYEFSNSSRGCPWPEWRAAVRHALVGAFSGSRRIVVAIFRGWAQPLGCESGDIFCWARARFCPNILNVAYTRHVALYAFVCCAQGASVEFCRCDTFSQISRLISKIILTLKNILYKNKTRYVTNPPLVHRVPSCCL